MQRIKPIETCYNGYRFRSRLEARWAVFFDAAGIKYEYEREGFDLDGEYYLPDFYLSDWDCFAEIKHEKPILYKSSRRPEYIKCQKLAQGTRRPVLLIGGQPFVSIKIVDKIGQTPSYKYSIAIFCHDMLMHQKLSNDDVSVNWIEYEDHSKLSEAFYTLSQHLYGFIFGAYNKHPEYFNRPMPIRGDVNALIEADKQYYTMHFKKEHKQWQYGISDQGYVFERNKHLKEIFICSEWSEYYHISDPLKLTVLYDEFLKARQARFEYGETG